MAHLHARAVTELGNATIAGAWSRTRKTADEFASKYSTASYPTITEMVKSNKSDLVLVCNAHPFHHDAAVEAAEAGANVLIEKPLASSLADCDAIISACRKNKVKLGVISQRRWLDPVKRVKSAIESGKIGKPALATINLLGWRDKDYYDSDAWRGRWDTEGGGVLVNQAPHQLDIMLWMMGDIDEVYGIWKNLNHPYIEVEDTALAIVKFKSGAIGNILVSNSQKPGLFGKVHIHGTSGASVGVQTDGGAMFIAGKTGVAEPPVNDLWTVPGEETMLNEWVKNDTEFFKTIDATVYYMKCQIAEYLDAVSAGREPMVTGDDGRKVVELFAAVYRSTRDNRPVKFPLVPENGFDGRPV